MKNLWYIAKKDLLQILRDRNSLFLLLIVPLVLIVVIGFAFGNLFGSGSSQITITVAVSNQDSGFVGKAVTINSFDQLVPGYAIFFALFGVNAAAATILQE